MTDKNGVGVTEIGHDSESRVKVILFTLTNVRLFNTIIQAVGASVGSASNTSTIGNDSNQPVARHSNHSFGHQNHVNNHVAITVSQT